MKSSFLAFVSTVSEILKVEVIGVVMKCPRVWKVEWEQSRVDPRWFSLFEIPRIFPNKKYKQPKTVKKQMFFSIITKMSNGLLNHPPKKRKQNFQNKTDYKSDDFMLLRG